MHESNGCLSHCHKSFVIRPIAVTQIKQVLNVKTECKHVKMQIFLLTYVQFLGFVFWMQLQWRYQDAYRTSYATQTLYYQSVASSVDLIRIKSKVFSFLGEMHLN